MPASTTPGGFPYPLPGDPLSDLPSVARSLAERIDANTAGLATYVDAASFHYDLVDTAITGELSTPLSVNTPAQGIESATWGGVTAAGGAVTLPKGLWSVCIRFALSWANDGYTVSTPVIIYSPGGQAVQPIVRSLAGNRVLCGLRQGGGDTWYDEVHPSSPITHVDGRFSGHMLRHIA